MFCLHYYADKKTDDKRPYDFTMELRIKQCLHKVEDKKNEETKPPISTVL